MTTAPAVYRRNATLAPADPQGEPGMIRMTASTDAAVPMGGWSEILVHADDCIDRGACRALLVNHDANQIAGVIRDITVAGGQVEVSAKVDPDARLASGLTVARAIEIGALKGVSIGYSYDPTSVTWDEETRTATVPRWRLLEVTLTPIPADPAAALRAAPVVARALPPTSAPSAPHESKPVSESPATTNAPGLDAGATITMIRNAEELGLRASDYIGKPNAAEQMLADAAKARAKTQVAAAAPAQITADEQDKITAEAADYLGKRSLADVARRFAMRRGDPGAVHWGRTETINWLLGRGERAVLNSSNFNQVTILASKKAMLNAYDGYKPWSDAIVMKESTSDFKTFRVAGLALGDFNEPGEGNAFADLAFADNLTGSGVLTFRGGLIELSEEAMWNDEMGAFLKTLADLGRIAARHQDIRVGAALEALSFTNASAGTGTNPLSAATLATAWASFMNILGPHGQRLGIAPKFLVVPPSLAQNAASLLTLNNGGAATTGVAGLAANSTLFTGAPMTPVCGIHLANATAFYLMGAPEDGSCLTVLKHTEYPVPAVEEIDSGAVASRKFKVKYPMQVITATHSANRPVLAVKGNGA